MPDSALPHRQYAEFVTFGVGQDHPGRRALPDIHPARPGAETPPEPSRVGGVYHDLLPFEVHRPTLRPVGQPHFVRACGAAAGAPMSLPAVTLDAGCSNSCVNMDVCQVRQLSCTPTLTPSTRRSSNATTPGCGAAR